MAIAINGSGTITGISVGGIPDGVVDTDVLAANAVTYAKIGTTEQGQLCKAWVNFDGTSNSANLSGTYSQSGTTVTVTATAHGLIVGSSIYSDITSGTGVDGTYTVATVTDVDTFTYTAGTSLTTSGNITLRRNTIRASYNVSSITDNGTGDYTVNFTTAMADANYVVTGAGEASTSSLGTYFGPNNGTAPTTTACRIRLYNSTPSATDRDYVNVAIFR
jgi:hypothetical protein